jgi:hypothetical protein
MRRLVLIGILCGCQPNFGNPLSLVSDTRLLAVRGEPAEAIPGASVKLTPLVASPSGTVALPALDWSLCLQPLPSTENDVVNAACLQAGGTSAVASGDPAPTLTLPGNGCQLFGPDLPPQVAGQPSPRPQAPDATGGYYQPLRIDLGKVSSIALERIQCGAAGASMDLAEQFQMKYSPNRNPALTPLLAMVNGQAVALDQVARGARVTLVAGWTPESVESYPVVDALDQLLVEHREAMSVAWFASDGAFTDEETGRAENDSALSTSNTWMAPSIATKVYVWLVLHDSRGGQDFASYTIVVR